MKYNGVTLVKTVNDRGPTSVGRAPTHSDHFRRVRQRIRVEAYRSDERRELDVPVQTKQRYIVVERRWLVFRVDDVLHYLIVEGSMVFGGRVQVQTSQTSPFSP